MLSLTIADGRLGADRVDHAGERLVAVAERALVVRVVRRPHHPVDADAVDQLEPERVDHERRVHVVLPVVLRRRARSRGRPCAGARRTRCSASWMRRRDPVDAALEPADPQARDGGRGCRRRRSCRTSRGTAPRCAACRSRTRVVLGTATPAGSRRCGAPPGDRSPRSPPTPGTSRASCSRSGLPSSLPGLQRQQERLEPERPSARSSVRRAPSASHQLMSPTP